MSENSRWVPLLAAAVAALIGLGIFLWPTVARSSNRVDVVVAGDGFVAQARETIERRVRERGLGVVTLAETAGSLCSARDDLLELMDREDPAVLVLSFRAAEPACDGLAAGLDATKGLYDQVVAAAGDARVVLALQPGLEGSPEAQDPVVRDRYQALLSARRVSVADPSALLGGAAAPALMRCQWWDICGQDGVVPVREADGGTLTGPGGERFARVIVGVVP